MKFVFFGTPYYVVPILDALYKNFRGKETPIAAVVTQPPKPVGRDQVIEYSAVDTWAHKKEIPTYFDAQKMVDESVLADVGIIASYGALIPESLINYFPHGIVVVHPSLLPEFRWGSPVPATIITATNPTGVSFIKMDKKFDHGPVISMFREDVLPDDTNETLRDRLFAKSAEVLCGLLPAYIQGKIKSKAQDDSKATFARMIKKDDSFIPFDILLNAIDGKTVDKKWLVQFITIAGKPYETDYSPIQIDRFIRAMHPWPKVWTEVSLEGNESKRVVIQKAHFDQGSGKLVLDSVQLEGKNPVTWKEFTHGYPMLFK